uniref:Uncharacterized protein n=1 Tax=Oryza rufipogon TaxID=4529 RepID=A0A0E0MWB7_ORYRU
MTSPADHRIVGIFFLGGLPGSQGEVLYELLRGMGGQKVSSSPMASSNSWMNAPPPPPTPSTLSLSPHTTASSTLHVALVVVLCVAALAGALLFSIVLHIVYTKWLKPRIFARAAPPPPSQEVVVQMPPFSRGLASVKKLIGR